MRVDRPCAGCGRGEYRIAFGRPPDTRQTDGEVRETPAGRIKGGRSRTWDLSRNSGASESRKECEEPPSDRRTGGTLFRPPPPGGKAPFLYGQRGSKRTQRRRPLLEGGDGVGRERRDQSGRHLWRSRSRAFGIERRRKG